VLPLALQTLADLYVRAGEFAAAAALIEESDAITAATGNPPLNDPRGIRRRAARECR
jgi:hypothetical protein